MPGLQMKYFVLKPAGSGKYAEASRIAMLAYADIIKSENLDLFLDITKWVQEEEKVANQLLQANCEHKYWFRCKCGKAVCAKCGQEYDDAQEIHK